MRIRILTPTDASQYRALRVAALRELPPAFGTPPAIEEKLPLSTFAARLQETQDQYFLGAFVSDILVGTLRFSRFEGSNEKHRGYIAGFYVRPSFRGRGLGRGMLSEVLAKARKEPDLRRIHLTVVTHQVIAIQLYESLGFIRYATEREAFSANGQFYDEYLMELVL